LCPSQKIYRGDGPFQTISAIDGNGAWVGDGWTTAETLDEPSLPARRYWPAASARRPRKAGDQSNNRCRIEISRALNGQHDGIAFAMLNREV